MYIVAVGQVTKDPYVTNEEIEDVMNLIEIFFKEMEKKNAQLKELQSKINKTNDQVTQLNTEIDLINEKTINPIGTKTRQIQLITEKIIEKSVITISRLQVHIEG